jgi:hypothetical protein
VVNLKLLIIFCLLLSNFQILEASVVDTDDQTIIKEINRNWSHSPLFERADHNSKIKIKLFKRVLWVGKIPINVAQTNFTYLTNPKGQFDLKALSETMIKSFPKGTLKAHPISNGYRLEGEWKDINRKILIDILKKNNDFINVTTFYRPSMAKSFNKELEEFHSLLKSYEENKVTKTSFINFLINDANAVTTIPSLAGVTTLLTTPNPTTGTTPLQNAQTAVGSTMPGNLGLGAVSDTGLTNLGTGMTNLGTGMTNLGTSVAPLAPAIEHHSTAIDGLTGAIKDTNVTITQQGNQANQTALTISRESNATIKEQGDQANKTALTISRETNATINRQGDQANANYKETNRIMAMALDPDHMAKLAFYTAAGAALGGLAVNLAVEGVAAGFSFLKEFFTGAKENAIDWDKFQKAIATWDSQVAGLINYEKIVDDLISSFNFFQGEHLDNDYLTNLEKTKLAMKFDEREENSLSEDKNLAKDCRYRHYEIADYLHNKIEEYDKILKFAKDQHLKIEDNQKYFCQQLSELKQRILQAEQQMADIRVAILKAEGQFYEKASDARDDRHTDVDKVNSQIEKTIKAQQKFDKGNNEQIADLENKTRDEWVDQCLAQKNDEGKRIEAERQEAMKKYNLKFLITFSFKQNCREIFKKIHQEIKRDNDVQKDLASAAKVRKGLDIEGNVNVDVALSEEQQKWFTRIHMDAHCYPFAHGGDELVPKECKEFPEMLSSMRLSKGADKAQAAYKANCEKNYAAGLKKLATH